jgi:nucleoid DNA-binding protein
MTEADLVAAVKVLGMTKKEATAAVDVMIVSITSALKKGVRSAW